ncbi:MAG: hypothetical protein Q9214_005201 [Letrouitia sp. 1 TL-2023]
MSAINVIGDVNAGIYLFYASKNNSLAVTRFGAGSWYDTTNNPFPGAFEVLDRPRTVSNTSRSLAVSIRPGNSSNEVYMCYEDSVNAITLLKASFNRSVDTSPPVPTGSLAPGEGAPAAGGEGTNENPSILSSSSYASSSLPSPVLVISGGSSSLPEAVPTTIIEPYDLTTQWNWQPIFHNQQTSSLRAPFSSSFDGSGVSAVFMETKTRSNKVQLTEVRLSDDTSQTDTNHTPKREFAFWVNKTILIDAMASDAENLGTSNGIENGTPSSFPYARLGGTAQWNGTVLYLYHQVNDTTFVEDQFDETTGIWVSTNVTIRD